MYLVYANSGSTVSRLLSQRTETVQRMYFQCDPKEDAADWDDERIWAEFRKRVNGNGLELREGAVLEKIVLPFRSLVHTPMRYGNLFLVGDAAHNVPPTGAKGLNLAIHDAHVLFEGLDPFYSTGSTALLDSYSDRALERVWKAQHFSYWMTSMLHTVPGADDFERGRQLGELNMVVSSHHAQAYLAEAYTGLADVDIAAALSKLGEGGFGVGSDHGRARVRDVRTEWRRARVLAYRRQQLARGDRVGGRSPRRSLLVDLRQACVHDSRADARCGAPALRGRDPRS